MSESGPVVGKKQILRLLKENQLDRVRIATDCDADYALSIATVAKQHDVNVEFCGTMQEIADSFEIEVPSGAVGFLKNK